MVKHRYQSAILQVPPELSKEYNAATGALITATNRLFFDRAGSGEISPGVPRDVLEDNHRNHVLTLAGLISLDRLDVLEELVPWVYRAYFARGVDPGYFPVVLGVYNEAAREVLSPDAADFLDGVYRYLQEGHERFLESAQVRAERSYSPAVVRMTQVLLEGDSVRARGFLSSSEREAASTDRACMELVQPALYRVGDLWEKNIISVAHEHMASSLVSRLMAERYVAWELPEPTKGTVVISTVANEFHEIGGRMVADLLEQDGWDVHFLGSNVPLEELIRYLEATRPFLVGLSAALHMNLLPCRQAVERIRQTASLADTRIMVGGRIFNMTPGLWSDIGADASSLDAGDAVTVAARLWEKSGA